MQEERSEQNISAAVKDYLKHIPESYRSIYLRAMGGNRRADAVKAACLQCACWQRKEVALCTVQICPLYPYRTYET